MQDACGNFFSFLCCKPTDIPSEATENNLHVQNPNSESVIFPVKQLAKKSISEQQNSINFKRSSLNNSSQRSLNNSKRKVEHGASNTLTANYFQQKSQLDKHTLLLNDALRASDNLSKSLHQLNQQTQFANKLIGEQESIIKEQHEQIRKRSSIPSIQSSLQNSKRLLANCVDQSFGIANAPLGFASFEPNQIQEEQKVPQAQPQISFVRVIEQQLEETKLNRNSPTQSPQDVIDGQIEQLITNKSMKKVGILQNEPKNKNQDQLKNSISCDRIQQKKPVLQQIEADCESKLANRTCPQVQQVEELKEPFPDESLDITQKGNIIQNINETHTDNQMDQQKKKNSTMVNNNIIILQHDNQCSVSDSMPSSSKMVNDLNLVNDQESLSQGSENYNQKSISSSEDSLYYQLEDDHRKKSGGSFISSDHTSKDEGPTQWTYQNGAQGVSQPSNQQQSPDDEDNEQEILIQQVEERRIQDLKRHQQYIEHGVIIKAKMLRMFL